MQTQVQSVSNEFFLYWEKLSSVQKDLMLELIKNIVGEEVEKEEPIAIPKEVMDGIWKDREDYLNGIGKTYSREEAREYIIRNAAKK